MQVQALPGCLMTITIKGNKFFRHGKPIRFAGDHTWNTVQRIAGERISIDKITGNFTRLWTVETRGFIGAGSPWGSNTPGLIKVQDGPWKKDGSLNGGYYKAMEKAVKAADKRDVVTGVVLFEGSIQDIFPKAWDNHPLNGLGPKSHDQLHAIGPWNKYQRAHVKRLTKTLAPYDNVMWEVGNELMGSSTNGFQQKVVKWLRKWSDKLIGVSYARGIRPSNGKQETWMVRSGADYALPQGSSIAQGGVPGFKGPQFLDTDHAWPLCSNVGGLQSAWRQGFNVAVMNGFDGTMLRNQQSLQPDLAFVDSVV